LILPALAKDWTYKNAMFVASFGYICTVSAGALTSSCATQSHIWCGNDSLIYLINIGASIINGIAGPLLWLSASRYITACTNETNKGTYFGIFSSFVFAASVAGSILAACVIPHFGKVGFYLVACAFICCAILMLSVAPQVAKYDANTTADESLGKKIKNLVNLAVGSRMRPFLLFQFLVGILLAVYNGFEFKVVEYTVPSLPSGEPMGKDDVDYVTALVFTYEGIATIIASFAAGKLADMLPRKIVLNIFNIFGVLAIGVTLLSYYTVNLSLTYLMAILWSMAYSGGSTLIGIVRAKDFDGSLEAYSIAQFMPNLATAVGFGLCIMVTNFELFLLIISVLVVITIISTSLYKQK